MPIDSTPARRLIELVHEAPSISRGINSPGLRSELFPKKQNEHRRAQSVRQITRSAMNPCFASAKPSLRTDGLGVPSLTTPMCL